MESQKITLVSKEGEKFELPFKITKISKLLESMLEDNSDTSEPIPLAEISTSTLKSIIEYCEHYEFEKTVDIRRPLVSNDLKQSVKDPWEADFIGQFNLEDLIAILLGANYLEITPLFELACAAVAAMYKGKNFE